VSTQGFGAHPHSNAEIFSYVVSGSLEHKDTLTNQEVIERGGVQFTSAGSGVIHSEYNHSATEPVHFLQVWLKPDQRGLKPGYQTADFADEEKHGKLCLIVSSKYQHSDEQTTTTVGSEGSIERKTRPVIVNQDAQVYASMLAKDEAVTYGYGQERCGYLHVCQTGGRLRLRLVDDDEADEVSSDRDEIVLEGGDGVFIRSGTRLQMLGANDDNKRVEFLLFDLAKEE
jgi:redox-sensitive bicupin YhaK (pirin superfamily)